MATAISYLPHIFDLGRANSPFDSETTLTALANPQSRSSVDMSYHKLVLWQAKHQSNAAYLDLRQFLQVQYTFMTDNIRWWQHLEARKGRTCRIAEDAWLNHQ